MSRGWRHAVVATALTGAGAVAFVGCGGSSVGSSFPAAGHGSPAAATYGFFSNAAHNNAKAACSYVVQSDEHECETAVGTAGFKASGLKVGAVSINGSQALVTVLGKLCVNGDSGRSCTTNKNENSGQPTSGGSGAFAKAYQAALSGNNTANAAIPCLKSTSGWNVDLGSA